MESLWQDIRFAFRTLRARPGFLIVAVATIAIGVGANTAIFSVIYGVLLEPIPVEEPSRIVVPDVIAPTGFSISLSIPNFRDWRDRSRTFETFAAVMNNSRTLTGGDRPEIIRTRWVLGDFFETLGVDPARGRVFAADETFEGAEAVAVVTHGFWQRQFSGTDPLGQTLILDNQPFTVVGVMPEDFAFPDPRTEIYLPMGFFAANLCWENRSCSQGSFGLARLAPGVSLAMAQQDLDRVVREIEAEEGEAVAHPVLAPLTDFYVGDIRRNLWVVMGAVAFVLLIACANVASLLLARGEGRRKEIALRTALGAGKRRIVRQFLTESMVLAAIGGVVGVGLALLGIRLLVPVIEDALPALMAQRIGLNGPVLAFTLVATALAGLLAGLAPTLRVSRTEFVGELKEGGRGSAGSGRNRLRAGLVVAEVALSVILLVGAGLMVQSLRQLRNVDKGFQEAGIFTADITLPRARYDGLEPTRGFYRDLHQRVAALPSVESASLTQILPLAGSSWEQRIFPEGVPQDQENESSVLHYIVTPEHFEVFGIPLLDGRTFEPQDRDGNVPIAVIDETMAERFWPGESAVGKRVTFESIADPNGGEERVPLYRTVVGVVRNVRHYELENAARITVYVPFEQTEGNWTRSYNIVVKTAGDPLALTEPVRAILAQLDPEVPLASIQTMETIVDDAMSGPRSVGTLLTVFGVVAVLLSAIGLFGLMSFTVAQRVRDIGVRMALGATAGKVVSGLSGEGLRLTAAGIVVGLVGALLLTRVISGMLFEVNALDPVTFGAVPLILLGVAMLAIWIPALRATRVDPAVVLRED